MRVFKLTKQGYEIKSVKDNHCFHFELCMAWVRRHYGSESLCPPQNSCVEVFTSKEMVSGGGTVGR